MTAPRNGINQEIPLLITKFHIPAQRPEWVPRPHLIAQLNQGLHHKLTLISAPAGFGKTTLLSEWIHCGGEIDGDAHFAWISLDEGDNDPRRFWTYFMTALQRVEATIGQDTLSALSSFDSPPMEDLLTRLINQVSTIPKRFILVLDDYHIITAPPIHNAMIFLLDHLPDNMHLVIATRADPPLKIARLRGRGQLTELRQADLRFTLEETTEFLKQIISIDLTADATATLAAHTEGWIVGLQMAAISMQGQEEVTSFIQAFKGSNKYILDYLVEEVLERQPKSIQTFLLQTSILDRLSGPLCDAVVKETLEFTHHPDLEDWRSEIDSLTPSLIASPSSQSILEYLETSNLFVVPLDNERRWYRYHRLFSNLLRSWLHQANPDLVKTLHHRASIWYEQHAVAQGEMELMPSAIAHALSAQDFERAASLIEQVAQATFMRSELVTFLGWVEALPAKLLQARPSLCVFQAWALLLNGHSLDVIEAWLQNVDTDADHISAQAAPLRALVATLQGRVPFAATLCRQALEQLPESDSLLRGMAAVTLSNCYFIEGDTENGSLMLDQAASIGQKAGNVMIVVLVQCNMAQLCMKQGQLHRAKSIYQQALDLATDGEGGHLPVATKAMTGLGELWREWNDLDTSLRYLTQALELSKQLGQIAALEGYASLARVKQAQGDVIGARNTIKQAQQIATQFVVGEIYTLATSMYQAQLWIAQGNLKAAMVWAEKRGLDREVDSLELAKHASLASRLRKYEFITYARLLIAQNRPQEALALMDRLMPKLEHMGRKGMVIELQVLRALAFHAQGHADQARTALEQALTLAEQDGYVRIFLDEGAPIAPLIYEAATRGIEYARHLLSALQGEMQSHATRQEPVSPPALVEPLSQREMDVLHLVAQGLTNQAIAQELFITLPTVKWHTSHIYAKLGVNTRTQAVAKARNLGILPPSTTPSG